jgi:O-antigen ligase
VLGIGLKNYEIAIRQYDITGQFTEFGNMPIVHNILLLYLAEIGLLGMSAFVWLLVSLARRGLGFVRGREAALAPSVAVGLLVSGLVLLAHNMVHVGLGGDPQLFVVFWFLAGLLVALTSWKDAPSGFVSQQGVSRA